MAFDHNLEQFIASMQALNRQMRSAAFDQAQQPITRVQWLLMRHLNRRGGRTIGQLADHLDVRASTMSQMLDRLEKLGYLIRVQDVHDARVKIIQLTQSGIDMINQTESIWMEALSGPFEQLSAEEKHMLTGLMTKLVNHLPRREDA